MLRQLIALLATFAILVCTSPVQTQASTDAEAQALFEAGRQAFESGKYDAALGRWQEAHSLSGRPQLLFNIGLAFDRLRRDGEAIEAFEAFLVALPDDARASEARARIEAMKAARVPSPKEAAQASSATAPPVQASPAATQMADDPDDSPWYGSWVLWAGVGGAVVASLVIVALASPADSATERAKPNSGLTVQALDL